MIFSGEVHPFRLPVPSLYLDVFQKIKALGFNTVSFYVDWALLEGKPGSFSAEGIFDLNPFFDAAKEAGIYLIARPGPYINAEASGGGFPGWLSRVRGQLRTRARDFMEPANRYTTEISKIIAKAQITNGGPVILFQPENEYTYFENTEFDPEYMQEIMDVARDAGIDVPFISNDASPRGHNAPGTGVGAVDIYGHDNYPVGFDCSNPTAWEPDGLQTNWREKHLEQSPNTPFALVEYQGGAFDPWGGAGFDKCAIMTNPQFQSIAYKQALAAGVAILNIYMTYGGTNWGNLGHPNGYTSYDYGAAITESRNVSRDKYSEVKLIAKFLKASPSYLETVPENATTGVYTDATDLTVTPLIARGKGASYYIVRHTEYTSTAVTQYKLKLPTSAGELEIPQTGGSLTLNGRDSKVHVVDYDVAGKKILYSTAEVFTWKKFADYSVLVVYGNLGEHHELAVSTKAKASVLSKGDNGISTKDVKGSLVISWDVAPSRGIVKVDDLLILLLDRNSAYEYWVPELTAPGEPAYTTRKRADASIIVRSKYLVRTAYTKNKELHIKADFNETTTVEVIGAPKSARKLVINGVNYKYDVDSNGFWTTTVKYKEPQFNLPKLSKLHWKAIDSLPELSSKYDDSAWTVADHKESNNTLYPLKTPVSLYSSDYGYHTGYLIYRGHFEATGEETALRVRTMGGFAFGESVWLNDTFLGSWAGDSVSADHNGTYELPKLDKGKHYVLTLLIDNMGLEENFNVGGDMLKSPRGILEYELVGRRPEDISWKFTGNLGGEDYQDKVRGPLNEGGLYAERQGWHQPAPPSQTWKSSSPFDGIKEPGVTFYTTSFDLNIPSGYDVPLYFVFQNNTVPETSLPQQYRVQLYVNGYQFGKYTNHIGPQSEYPVPPGILNYKGKNWIALSLWAHEETGAKLEGFELIARTPVVTSFSEVKAPKQPKYKKRPDAY